jgi:alpha-beta hydrolase superfamily lysophospholipase
MRLRATSFTLALALLAGACAPGLQQAQRPPVGFSGARLEPNAFVSFDGARLGLTRWEAAGGAPWAVIVGVHGMNDYANAFHLAAPFWAARGITTLAYDQRGFGRSPARGRWAPEALSTEDLRTIVALARAQYPRATIAVAGESLGGAVAIEAFASDRPPAADRLILLAPAVWGWSRQPFSYVASLWLADHLDPGWVVTPPRFVTNKIFPSDNMPEMIAMGRDPLMIWGARVDALYGLVGAMQKAWRETGDVRVPTLFMYGAHDQIIPKRAAFEAAARLPAGDRTAYYANGWHLLLRDLHANLVWADVAAFVQDPAAPLPSGAPPVPPPPVRTDESRRAGVVTSAPGA